MRIRPSSPAAVLLTAALTLSTLPVTALAQPAEAIVGTEARLTLTAQTRSHHMGEQPWDEREDDIQPATWDEGVPDSGDAALLDAVRLRVAGMTGLSYRLVSVDEEAGVAPASAWATDGAVARADGASVALRLRVSADLSELAEVWVSLKACKGDVAGWTPWVSASATELFSCPEDASIGEVALAVTEPGAEAPAALSPAWGEASAAAPAMVAASEPVLGAASATWTRLAGLDRYGTAANISAAGFGEGTVAVLTTGERFPDALAAGAVAGALDAPILLTPQSYLSTQARADLERRGVEQVVVVGGEGSVSTDVTDELKEMGIDWERVAGDDRVGTSLEALAYLEEAGVTFSSVIVASGNDFPDALSISPYAYAKRVPIVLTNGAGTLTDKALTALESVSSVIIVGGEGSVAEAVEYQLDDAGISYQRISGDDRYETSAAVARFSCESGLSWDVTSVASGKTFPDALAGGALAGTSAGPLLVADHATDPTLALLAENADSVEEGYVLGGASSVPFDDPIEAYEEPQSDKTGYQNPAGYYQVSSENVTITEEAEAPFDYITPSRISADATRQDCIDAFVGRAAEYVGTPYVWNYSCAPGVGVDCIGLVYQCAYACGMDLGGGTSDEDFNPWAHYITGSSGWHSHDANNFWDYGRALHVPLEERQVGDVLSWPGHVAIYIGDDQMIQAYSPATGVIYSSIWSYGTPRGCIRLFQ